MFNADRMVEARVDKRRASERLDTLDRGFPRRSMICVVFRKEYSVLDLYVAPQMVVEAVQDGEDSPGWSVQCSYSGS